MRGIPAAAGYAIGPAWVMRNAEIKLEKRSLADSELDAEIARFDLALEESRKELEALVETTKERMGEHEAEIFETHLLFLEDDELIGGTRRKIRGDKMNAEYALHEASSEIIAMIESLDDEYLKERAADFRDVTRRILGKLTGQASASWTSAASGQPFVLLAQDLTPSDTAMLDKDKVAGFATEIGGRTSHSAIMARSLGIPAVVGLGSALASVQNGQMVVLDGVEGTLYIDPPASVVEAYRRKQGEHAGKLEAYRAFVDRPSVTADGQAVELVANIGNPRDALAAKEAGAEGVGLYRTEFLYMDRDALPTEDEQFEAYRQAVEAFGKDQPVVIRTLDIGGDKKLPYLPLPEEENPFLGVRAIRLCLEREDIFRTQLRAILRASAFGNVKIMFPMIATLQEWQAASAVLAAAKSELASEGVAFNAELETGIMIEIPAAAVMADQLAKAVDFFSIGTNDLVQYMMAADRMNEKLAHLNDPFHPPVLRLIRGVIRAAASEGKWVGMCGEMAGQPLAIPLLLDMGLHEFSMSGSAVLPARALLSQLSRDAVAGLAEEALGLSDPEEVKALVKQRVPAVSEFI